MIPCLLLDGNAKTRLESRHGAFTGDRSQVLYTKIDRQPKRFTSSLGASGHEPTHDLGIITKATRDRPWDPSGLELETWHGKRPESKFVESTAGHCALKWMQAAHLVSSDRLCLHIQQPEHEANNCLCALKCIQAAPSRLV